MVLYRNVKRACALRGISVNRLESNLGFPRSSISKWDKSTPSVAKVKAVADALNVTIDKLVQEACDDEL